MKIIILYTHTQHPMTPTRPLTYFISFSLLETDWDCFEIHEASQVPTVPFTVFSIQPNHPPTRFSTIFFFTLPPHTPQIFIHTHKFYVRIRIVQTYAPLVFVKLKEITIFLFLFFNIHSTLVFSISIWILWENFQTWVSSQVNCMIRVRWKK